MPTAVGGGPRGKSDGPALGFNGHQQGFARRGAALPPPLSPSPLPRQQARPTGQGQRLQSKISPGSPFSSLLIPIFCSFTVSIIAPPVPPRLCRHGHFQSRAPPQKGRAPRMTRGHNPSSSRGAGRGGGGVIVTRGEGGGGGGGGGRYCDKSGGGVWEGGGVEGSGAEDPRKTGVGDLGQD